MKKSNRTYIKACTFLYGRGSDEYFTFTFNKDSDSYYDELNDFKKLFNSGDPDLKLAAWNAFCFRSYSLDREEFTDEEWAFIQEYEESSKNWIFCREFNPNKPFSSARLILQAAESDYSKTSRLYRKHLKEDGDFKLYTGKKLTGNNLDFYRLTGPYCFCVFEKESGNMVGMVGLYGYDEAKRMATAQWYIFKPYREKGYAKEAITTLAKRAFDGKLFEMRETAWRNKYRRHFAKIDLIRADIRETNIPSQKTAESCGFKYQYTDHRHYEIEGEGLEDAKIYELTPETIRIK